VRDFDLTPYFLLSLIKERGSPRPSVLIPPTAGEGKGFTLKGTKGERFGLN